jgi:bacterioferritin-associated ferredoxin
MDVLIDRCYCFDVRFRDLKEIASECRARTVDELQAEVTFGAQCRLCHPYVRRMLRTGEVVFREIVREADEPAEKE